MWVLEYVVGNLRACGFRATCGGLIPWAFIFHNVGLLALCFLHCIVCYTRFKSFAFYFLILELLAMAVRLLALGYS